MNSLPIIDFGSFRQNQISSSSTRQQIADQIATVCESIGFFYLAQHGIAPGLIEAAFEQSVQFFQLPSEVKSALAWTHTESNLGYVAVGRESLNPGKTVDVKEAFNIGSDKNPLNPNRWPDLPTFRPALKAFYQAANELAWDVLRAFALGLGLPEDFFVQFHRQPIHTLRLLHYPPHLGAPENKPANAIRAGEHSDYGSVTLLFQDQRGGLEVKTSAGHWVAAVPIPGTVLVNIGDLMQRWTCDRFRSTPHRVVLPQGDAAGQSRYSMALFCDPDPDTVVTALPTAAQGLGTVHYSPITAGDYLKERLRATY